MSDPWLAFRWGTAVLAIACAALAPLAARAEPPAPAKGAARPAPRAQSPADEARAHFDRGVAAHDQGKLLLAERLFTAAWGFQRSWDIAANLGIVERKLRRDASAAEHLAFALAALPPSESEKTRAGLQRELAAASSKVGKLSIRSAVTGAVVRVGGKIRGTTPLDGPVFEAPGEVTIELSKDGFEDASQKVTLVAGGAVDLTLSPAPKSRPGRSLVGPAIAFGASGLGLLTGLVAGGIAMSKMGELRGACGEELVCPDRLRGDAELGRVAAHIGTAGFVTAGVGAAVGLTLLLVPEKSTPAKVGISAGPAFLGVKGEF